MTMRLARLTAVLAMLALADAQCTPTLFVAGGQFNDTQYLSDCFAITAQASNWTVAPSLPFGLGESSTCVVGNTLYIMGGVSETAKLPRSDVLMWNGTAWASGPQLPYAVQLNSAAALHGDIYVTGGLLNADVGYTDQVVVLVGASGTWVQGPSLNQARRSHSTVAFRDQIWVLGGFPFGVGTEVLTPGASQWEQGVPIPGGPIQSLAVAVFDDQLFATGGDAGSVATANTWMWGAGAWIALPPMTTARTSHALAVFGGLLYAIGGEPGRAETPNAFSSVEVYNGTTNSWSAGIAVPCPGFAFPIPGVLCL